MNKFKRYAIEALCAAALLGCAFLAIGEESSGSTPPATEANHPVVLIVIVTRDGTPVNLFAYLPKQWDTLEDCRAEVRSDAFKPIIQKLISEIAAKYGSGDIRVSGKCTDHRVPGVAI